MAQLRLWRIGLVLLAVLAGAARGAGAQGGTFGIGPRVTFQQVDDNLTDTSSLRYFGGQMKIRLSPRTAVELSVDYKSETAEILRERVKSLPFQTSLLLYPKRSVFSPYVLVGIGWHSTTSTPLGPISSESTTTRDFAYHGGVGAELRAGRHIALHGDYRYTNVSFGGDEPGAPTTPGGLPIPGSALLQNALRLSHQGSMTNFGLTFFF